MARGATRSGRTRRFGTGLPVRMTAAFVFGCAILSSVGASPTPSPPPIPLESPSASITPLHLIPLAVPPAWAAFEQAWTNITAYSTTITVFERQGTQVQNSVFDYTFQKPSSATAHSNVGVDAGATLVWDGGDTVVAHRGTGLMALFKKRFSLHDPAVTTIRGSSVDQLSFGAFLAHSQGTPGTISQDAGPIILGIPTQAVTLIPTSAVANAGLTREIVDLSTITNLPVRVLGYEGETLVRQVDFSNVKVKALVTPIGH
jgi:hypothetical protein